MEPNAKNDNIRKVGIDKNSLALMAKDRMHTLATVSPMGHGRCGDRVANTPILPPFNLGTLTY